MRKTIYSLAVLLSVNGLSFADESDKKYPGIEAIVNGEIITQDDLDSETRNVLATTGGQDNREMKVAVLKEMINSKLKWQHVSKFSPKGGWVDDSQITETFESIAARNNMSPKEFRKELKSKNINEQDVRRKIRNNLSWIAYIQARYGKFVKISQSELKSLMKSVKSRKDKTAFYVERMFFPLTKNEQQEKILQHIKNIEQSLRNGGNFAELARQFSSGSDANNGGDLGWIVEGQVSREEYSALLNLSVGDYKIVSNSRGYFLLHLKDKKEAGTDDKVTTIKFIQVAIPKPKYANGQDTFSLLKGLKDNFAKVRDFLNQARTIGLYVSEPITGVLESMNEQARNALRKCQKDQKSEIISNDKAFFVFCVVDRREEKIPEPTENDIASHWLNEKMSSLANKELRELQEKADVKLDQKYGNWSDFF